MYTCRLFVFFQAEDGIRDLVRSRGLGDVYKRQAETQHADALAYCRRRRAGWYPAMAYRLAGAD